MAKSSRVASPAVSPPSPTDPADGDTTATVWAQSLLIGLTGAQQRAVISPASPLCVLAGAGAGKTRVLTRRIGYRLATGTADASHTLALTFTRKAAGELADRLRRLGVRDQVAAGTIHATAFAQLRRFWADSGRPAPTLLDRKARLLGPLVGRRPALAGVGIADIAAEIEWAKARMVAPTSYEAAAADARRRLPAAGGDIAAIYSRYEDEKRTRRLVDFDDLLVECAYAIETDPAFAASQRWRWRHVFVDEYQDINPLQHRLLLAWLGDRTDFCVVGDANQSIYSWNGADPSLLTRFAHHWPEAETISLDENHRCSPQVVAAAAAVLGAGGAQLSSSQPDGPPPTVRCYPSDGAEAQGVASEVRQARSRGLGWSQLAVLARTNAQLSVCEAALRGAGIPHRVTGGTALLDVPAVRSILDDLRRRPTSPFGMVAADIKAVGRGEERADQLRAGDDADRRALEQLGILVDEYQLLDSTPSVDGWLAWLRLTIGSERSEMAADAVSLSTFHRAKGLEWTSVWVIGVEEGLVPIRGSSAPSDLDEERRLLYVALTRASRDLYCSWASRRSFGKALVTREPSRWLESIAAACEPAAPGRGDDDWRRRLEDERQRLGSDVRHRRAQRGLPLGLPPVDEAVLAGLQRWRSSAARGAGVPPHVVLHDVTLAALASLRPRCLDELLAVPGLGPVKASRYAETLLKLIGSDGSPTSQRASA